MMKENPEYFLTASVSLYTVINMAREGTVGKNNEILKDALRVFADKMKGIGFNKRLDEFQSSRSENLQ